MDEFHPVRGQRVSHVKLLRSRELRKDMTPAERVLWARLRSGRLLGFRFRRQQVIAGFIVDFYCHAARLVIELDGSSHQGQADYDSDRDSALMALGLTILRFSNEDALTRLPDLIAEIAACCMDARGDLTPSPLPRSLAGSPSREERGNSNDLIPSGGTGVALTDYLAPLSPWERGWG